MGPLRTPFRQPPKNIITNIIGGGITGGGVAGITIITGTTTTGTTKRTPTKIPTQTPLASTSELLDVPNK
jgi:hypothetical protein